MEIPLSSAPKQRRIALLVDGDNAQPSLIDKVLAETGKYGIVTIRRVYGDWTTPNMNAWKDTLQIYSLHPIQQFRYTTGKNSTDSAMIIDAMDILYSSVVDGFCIASSDSDYTRLATRIRESGVFAMGVGRKDTPRAFVNACEIFVHTENLVSITPALSPGKAQLGGTEQLPMGGDPIPLLRKALDLAVQDNGWAFLGTVGSHLRQLDPSFDARTYGYKQLSLLIYAFPKVFETKEVRSPDGPAAIYVRLRE